MVKAADCGSAIRGFESHRSPFRSIIFCFSELLSNRVTKLFAILEMLLSNRVTRLFAILEMLLSNRVTKLFAILKIVFTTE